jgi:DNA-directed RNA polymerase I subunit RPA2
VACLCSYVDQVSRVATIERYKSHETAYVDDVKLLGNDYGTGELQSVLIRLRVPVCIADIWKCTN